MESSLELRRAHRGGLSRHRGLFAVLLIVCSFVLTGAFWLGGSGTAGPSITPLAGSSDGAVAAVTAMTSSVSRSSGGALLQTGVALSKIVVAASASNGIAVNVAWTNVSAAVRVLNNPNAQISIGLYHPIHTGNCVSASTSVDAPLVNITDTDSTALCGALDQAATGSASVSPTGKLLLAPTVVGGTLTPALDGSGAISACAAAANDNGGWCQPASISDSNQRALFVVASIVTPGTIPQGQQADLSTLDFFTSVRRVR